jgi:hypothetical protein
MRGAQIAEAEKLAPVVFHNIAAVDKGPYMVVQYVPNLGTGGAAATVAVATAAETMTFQVDAADPAGLDAIGNSSGELSLVADAYDTMGELVDAINATGAWRAYLLGALRADTPSHLLNFSAASCFGASGKTLYGDTSDSKDISYAISGEKFVSNGVSGHVKDDEDEVLNHLMHADINVTSASYAVLRYYSGKQGSTETKLIADVDLTTATNKQQGETNFAEPYISATRGERLVIRVIGLSNTAPSSPVINIAGKSIVYKNDRIVDTVPFPA